MSCCRETACYPTPVCCQDTAAQPLQSRTGLAGNQWRSSDTVAQARPLCRVASPAWLPLPPQCVAMAPSNISRLPKPPPLREGDASSPPLHVALNQMLLSVPDFASLGPLVRRCGAEKALLDGIRLHSHIRKYGFDRNTYIGNCLVLMYSDCESMEDAEEAFNRIHRHNSFSWSILIRAYAQNGNMDGARKVFHEIKGQDLVIWNTMIAACAHNGHGKEALDLFWQMQQKGLQPNKVTFLCILEACASVVTQQDMQKLLEAIGTSEYKDDVSVNTAILNLYGKHGMLDDARFIFDRIGQRDTISWNAMITVYAQNGHYKEALDLFYKMLLIGMKIGPVSIVCALDACANLTDMKEGHKLHTFSVNSGCETDVAVANSLLNMYSKCGSLLEARDMFERIPQQNVVSWTAMMTACVDNNLNQEALDLFHQMKVSGVKPNKVTYVCALDACSSLAALDEGLRIHAAIAECSLERDVLVGTALIHLYGKCGLIEYARDVFETITQQDGASWNAMLTAYAQNGHGDDTIKLFHQMQSDGVKPNKISFTCVITACSHMGWIDHARSYFKAISRDYGARPQMEHYASMIDLFGRAGLLEEAEDVIDSMPFGELASAWSSLLAACKTHGDIDRGVRAADHFAELDPTDATPYVMLGNIYAALDG